MKLDDRSLATIPEKEKMFFDVNYPLSLYAMTALKARSTRLIG